MTPNVRNPIRPALFLAILSASVHVPREARADEPTGLGAALAMEQRLVDAIQRCEKSVVAVARVRKVNQEESATAPNPPRLSLPTPFMGESSPLDPDFVPNEFGAGVVIDRSGLVLTNYHVIGDVTTSDHFVWSRRRPFRARVVAADPWYDLAVLRIDSDDLVPITFGDAKVLRKGHIVLALGNPEAIAADGEVSASWGIVSNLLRRAPRVPDRSNEPQGRETLHHYGTLIQTDAKLNTGFSGGALINLRGEMVGLITSYTAGTGCDAAAGFAIPVDDHFRNVVDLLKEGGRPSFGFLGAATEPLAVELRQRGLHGVRVISIIPGTPGASADLRTGDTITHVNHIPIYDDDDLFRVVGAMPAGAEATLGVRRGAWNAPNTRVLETRVTVTKKYVDTLRPQIATQPRHMWRGLYVDYATASPDFNRLVANLDAEGCVYVPGVQADSPAWQAGLRPGVFVSNVTTRRTRTPQEFHDAVRHAKGDVDLRVLTGAGPATLLTVSP
ncbi:MAG: trypsin-like peptidase domain-containing protein [Pirellulaceae bacterium]